MAVFGAATILLGLTAAEQAQAQTRRAPASQVQTTKNQATPTEVERQALMRRQVDQYRTRTAAVAARRAANAETAALNSLVQRRDDATNEVERLGREATAHGNALQAGLSDDWARLELLNADHRRKVVERDELTMQIPQRSEAAAYAEQQAQAAEQAAQDSLARPRTPQDEVARRAAEQRLIQEAEDRRLAAQRQRDAEAAPPAATSDTPPRNRP
ncbi:hypothetical protein ACFPIF_09540 [Brevundimonas faecalis]|uniref:hypothetical protein n=1 Tax=Brevundimonas faecalis TaxID=947378 RepID=UPI003608346C